MFQIQLLRVYDTIKNFSKREKKIKKQLTNTFLGNSTPLCMTHECNCKK